MTGSGPRAGTGASSAPQNRITVKKNDSTQPETCILCAPVVPGSANESLSICYERGLASPQSVAQSVKRAFTGLCSADHPALRQWPVFGGQHVGRPDVDGLVADVLRDLRP